MKTPNLDDDLGSNSPKNPTNPQLRYYIRHLVVICAGLFLLAATKPWKTGGGVPVASTLPLHNETPTRFAQKPVELNTSDEQRLATLPCIGRWRAHRIVTHRSQQGWFSHPHELTTLFGLDTCPQLLHQVYVDADSLHILRAENPLRVHRPAKNLNMAVAADLQAGQLLGADSAARLLLLRDRHRQLESFAQIAHLTKWPPATIRKLAANFYCGKRMAPLDLNLADSAQLRQIPGIGPVLAARIPRFRAALGFFHSVAQLQEVYGLGAENYARMQPFLYISAPLPYPRLSLRSHIDSLKHHPYLRPNYKLRSLQTWVSKLPENAPQDTLMHAPLDSAWLHRLLPYVALESAQ